MERLLLVRSPHSGRGLRAGQTCIRFPWELGRAYRLRTKLRLEGWPVTNSPGVSGSLLPPRTMKQGSSVTAVSAPRETEGNEKGEGSLSASIVPMKGGESNPRDPPVREGKSWMETCSGHLFVDL